jgi:CHAT domain-containing protein
MIQKVAGPDNPVAVPGLANLALLQWNMGNPDRAQEYFSESQSLFLRLLDQQFTFMSETERLGFLNSISFEFPLYFSFVYNYQAQQPGLVGSAYNVLLWEKGMVASSVRDQRRAIAASGDSEATTLFDRLSSKKSQLAALERTPPGSATSSATSIDALRNETEELEKQLTKKSSVFAEETRVSRPTWMQVQSTLRNHDAAIEFLRFPLFDGKKWTSKSRYVAFVLRSNDAAPKFVDLGDAGIPGAAEGLEGAPMEDYRQRVLMKSEAAGDFGMEFYRSFWKPLELLLKDVKRIYVSPDGALYQVSWAAIPRDDGRPLTDSYEIDIVVSTKDILRSRQRASPQNAVLIGNPQFNLEEDEHVRAVAALQTKPQSNVSCSETNPATKPSPAATMNSPDAQGTGLGPLAATQAEIQSLSGVFKKNRWTVESYCRDQALEEVVMHARHPRVLHMATHGFFEPDSPSATPQTGGRRSTTFEYPMLRSGLYFAGADRALRGSGFAVGVDTGIFTAYEATNLDLFGTELVVLSACETGLGKVENGEGIFGLRRAFQEAGAESVLMSMWSVPDRETKQFMTLFYEKWLSGMEKHRALSEAQAALREELRKEWKIDPPHFWAAFVLVGP